MEHQGGPGGTLGKWAAPFEFDSRHSTNCSCIPSGTPEALVAVSEHKMAEAERALRLAPIVLAGTSIAAQLLPSKVAPLAHLAHFCHCPRSHKHSSPHRLPRNPSLTLPYPLHACTMSSSSRLASRYFQRWLSASKDRLAAALYEVRRAAGRGTLAV